MTQTTPKVHAPTSHTLALPGATLYYEVRGAGPAVLMIPTGNGDADQYWSVANALADRYTVITYDRRGFSRSPLRGPVAEGQRVETDARDAHLLLDHVTEGPAHVFGSSSGAIVALHLLTTYPGQIRTLIAHEPPLASVLPDSAEWLEFYADLYETYRRSGPRVAREVFRARMGMTGSSRPPDGVGPPPERFAEMVTRVKSNQAFWFEHEVRAYPAYVPDVAALRAFADRLILANGTTSRDTFPYRPNAVLAERIGTEVAHFPGGHVGYVTQPTEFADLLASGFAPRDDG
jgi:pimeloyl-ACP methyl ester carboxylesterase